MPDITPQTPTAEVVKSRRKIVALGQQVFPFDGSAQALNSYSQFRSPELARLIDHERNGSFRYSEVVHQVDGAWVFPQAADVVAVMDAIEDGKAPTADQIASLGVTTDDLDRIFGNLKTESQPAQQQQPSDEEEDLTPQQKAARTRAANKARKEAEGQQPAQQQPVQLPSTDSPVNVDTHELAQQLHSLQLQVASLGEQVHVLTDGLDGAFRDVHDDMERTRALTGSAMHGLVGLLGVLMSGVTDVLGYLDQHADELEVPDEIREALEAIPVMLGDFDQSGGQPDQAPRQEQVTQRQAEPDAAPADPKPAPQRQQPAEPAPETSQQGDDGEIDFDPNKLSDYSLEELQQIADQVGVPNAHQIVYPLGLIRQIKRKVGLL